MSLADVKGAILSSAGLANRRPGQRSATERSRRRRDQGRARSSITHSAAFLAGHDTPLIGERAASRGRTVTEGGDAHAGKASSISAPATPNGSRPVKTPAAVTPSRFIVEPAAMRGVWRAAGEQEENELYERRRRRRGASLHPTCSDAQSSAHGPGASCGLQFSVETAPGYRSVCRLAIRNPLRIGPRATREIAGRSPDAPRPFPSCSSATPRRTRPPFVQ